MTAQKVKDWLIALEESEEINEFYYADNFKDALKIAVENIAELEQYRALGSTPAQICERIGGLNVELSKYYSLGTMEELKEAREKQIQEKWIECPYADLIMCPSCNAEFSTIDNCTEQFEYCPKCGKRLE